MKDKKQNRSHEEILIGLTKKLNLKDEKPNWFRVEPINNHLKNIGALEARTKDPLFTIGRQWQLGKFKVSNGGSLAKSQVKKIQKRFKYKNSERSEKSLEYWLNHADDFDKIDLEYKGMLKSEDESLEIKFSGNKGTEFQWFDFKIKDGFNNDDGADGEIEISRPRKFSFKSMPSRRWWQLEDKRINLEYVTRPYFNILTMANIDFLQSSIRSNTFSINIDVVPGNLLYINELKVVNTFGIITEFKPYNEQKNSLFSLTDESKSLLSNQIFIPKSILRYSHASETQEELTFKIDHLSNILQVIVSRNKSLEVNIEAKNLMEDNIPELSKKAFFIENKKVYRLKSDAEVSLSDLDIDSEDYMYLQQALVLGRVGNNIFPYLKRESDDSHYFFKANYNLHQPKYFESSLVDKFVKIKSTKIPEYETRVTQKTYLAFDSEGAPYEWKGYTHELAPRVLPIYIKFDSLTY